MEGRGGPDSVPVCLTLKVKFGLEFIYFIQEFSQGTGGKEAYLLHSWIDFGSSGCGMEGSGGPGFLPLCSTLKVQLPYLKS